MARSDIDSKHTKHKRIPPHLHYSFYYFPRQHNWARGTGRTIKDKVSPLDPNMLAEIYDDVIVKHCLDPKPSWGEKDSVRGIALARDSHRGRSQSSWTRISRRSLGVPPKCHRIWRAIWADWRGQSSICSESLGKGPAFWETTTVTCHIPTVM